jgi:IclR family acetate operon transcriptional repressor
LPPSISHPEKPRTRIQSASRAVQLLLLVARRPDGATASEAAAGVGLAVPTAYHLLATLADEGLLARDSRRRFVLGPRVGVLADAFLRDGAVPEYLAGPLQRLAEETQETAYLTAWRGGEIHALDSVEGANAVRVGGVARGPYRFPHARATGKLMLAFARADLRRAILAGAPLEPLTPRTITDRATLEVELAEIRERGWAEDHEEFAEGASCVAAPVLLDEVAVAAYTVSAPTDRFNRRHDELLAAVQRAATSAAGPDPDPPEAR